MKQSKEMIISGIPVKITKKQNLKNLYIRVSPPEGNVEVSSPISVGDEEIKLFLLKRMPEISKVRIRMKEQERQSKREYVSGESHYLWGKLYRLQVIHQGRKYNITKTPGKIVMTIPEDADINSRERLMNNWYRKELTRVLESFIPMCEEKTKVKADEYKIKNMKTRWGTCNIDKKRIWINLQLVKKPMECLEYVLIHELVHLIEKNHNNQFYALVEKFYPTWEDAKKYLDTMPLESFEDGEGNEDI